MRVLLAVLLLLAPPAFAEAGPHGRENHDEPPPRYERRGDEHRGDEHRGDERGGYERRGYDGGDEERRGYEPDGRERQMYGGPPPGYSGPPPGYGGPGPYYAAPPRTQQQRARDDVRSGRRVPLPYVIERLHRSTGAEYVDTREVRDPQGRPMYVLRFRQRGRYIDVPVDAETGMVQR